MRVFLFLTSICISCAIPMYAEDGNDAIVPDTLQRGCGLYRNWEKESIDLDQVVVTATRTPKLLSESPVLTQLISAADIQRLDVTNVEGLLQQELPGVEFSYSMNMQVNMNLAGFAGQSVLFLVDGERLAGETNDNIDYERLVIGNIDHIEIVKGAASALYGSSANGGVINIITKDVRRLPSWQLHTHGKWGSHGEQRYGLDLGLHRGIWANSLQVSYRGTDCYRVYNKCNDPIPLRIDYVPGQEVWSVNDRMVCEPNEALRLTGRMGFYRRQMVRNATESEHTRYYDYSAGVKADWHPTEHDDVEVSYSFDQYDKTRYYVTSSLQTSDLDVREYSNVQNSVRCLWNRHAEQGTITIGADYMCDYLTNTKLADADYHQASVALFAQYDWIINEQWELVSALRYDYFEAGSHSRLTPKVSASWRRDRWHLRGSYGMGFRAPTLKEMHYAYEAMPGWIIDGNADLTPEQSHNFTLSAEYGYGVNRFTLMGYYNHIADRITTGVPQSQSDGAHLPFINLPELDITGCEAIWQARWSNGFGAKLAYCYTYEHNPDQAPNQFMPTRPHAFNYRIDYERKFGTDYSLSLLLSGRWLSDVTHDEYRSTQHPEQGVMSVHYSDYHLHKVQLMQRWQDWLTLTFTVDNLLGYQPDNFFYNSPLTTGQTYSVGVNLSIENLYSRVR